MPDIITSPTAESDIYGSYQFANIATRFYIPLLTIVIPLTIGSFPNY